MIKKIYNITGKDIIIVELEDERFLSLASGLADKLKENLCHRLKDIKLTTDISRMIVPAENLLTGNDNIREIYDIIGADGNYYLLFLEGESKSEITVTPWELKTLLSCFEKTKTSEIPSDDGRF